MRFPLCKKESSFLGKLSISTWGEDTGQTLQLGLVPVQFRSNISAQQPTELLPAFPPNVFHHAPYVWMDLCTRQGSRGRAFPQCALVLIGTSCNVSHSVKCCENGHMPLSVYKVVGTLMEKLTFIYIYISSGWCFTIMLQHKIYIS